MIVASWRKVGRGVESDLIHRRRALEALRGEDAPHGAGTNGPSPAVRDDVLASWQRCEPVVSTNTDAAPADDELVRERWDHSAIRRAAPDVVAELERVALETDFMAAVTDARGQILWSSGGRTLHRHTERVNFTPGGNWDERSVGTNAIGLSLITGVPTDVFASEHWCDAVRNWVCYSAPVRGPGGEVIGVLDLSNTWNRANSMGMSTVSALARVAEHRLATRPLTVPGGSMLDMTLLGGGGVATLNDMPMLLTQSQLDYLSILETREGLTADQLRVLVHGEGDVSRSTVLAEVTQLNRALGGAIAADPFRLNLNVTSDRTRVLDHLRSGDLASACALYTGPLLPASRSPTVIDERRALERVMRSALLIDGTADQLGRFALDHADDVEVAETAWLRSVSMSERRH